MPKFYIGTAGWSYKDWVPVFYPKNQTNGFDWLQFYANYFNCVEVNATYYAYLDPRIINGWLQKIEGIDDFLFTLKLHQDFTHKKNFDDKKIKSMFFNLDILSRAERLGGLLIQFPYSFSFNASAAAYLNRLKDIFQNYNLFIEVRHKSWLNKKALEFFNDLKITFCIIDQPQIGEAVPFEPIITNDKAYLRFHGRNIEGWKKSINNFGKKQTYEEQSERYKYLYSPGELIEIEQKIKSIQGNVKEVYIIMNNHPQGDGVANAFELIHLLEEKTKIDIPQTLIKSFPRLERISSNN